MGNIQNKTQVTYEVEGVLNWGSVMHWSEEMVLKSKNDNLFEESVSHEELLGGTTDVSVSVLQSHTGESSLLDLKGDASGQVEVDLSLLGWMDSWVHGGSEDIEASVSDFINHLISF